MVSPDGDLYLMRPSAANDIQIENPDEAGMRLIEALDGERTRAELEEEFGEHGVADLLAQLEELGLVEDASDDDLIPDEVIARFDRQLRYFSDVSAAGPTPSQCQENLETSRVAVLGVGGLGGWAALALSCCGIGKMLLVDFDRVELCNLNRQVLYGEDDIGRLKVEAAAERLSSFNSEMKVEPLPTRLESEEEVAAVIANHELVIDAIDWPAHDVELWVNSACFAAGIPYIAMSHFPPIARVGPFYVPGLTGCYACQEIAYRRDYPLFDAAVEQRRAKSSPAATLGPACALIGGQVALDAMHYLTGLAMPSTLGAGHIYDLRKMQREEEPVIPESSCKVCARLKPSHNRGMPHPKPHSS